MTSITAIIPTTGRATLRRAVDSVLSQTWPVKELIIVHDTGMEYETVLRYGADLPSPSHLPASTRPILHLHTGGGHGACHARNLGAMHATGTHLAFLDDDDYWLDHHLSECLDRMRAAPETHLLCTGVLRLAAGTLTPTRLPPSRLTPAKLLVHNPGVRGSNILIQAATYRAIGGFDPTLPSSNDLDFAIRLLDHGALYGVVPSRTVVFRQHRQPRLSTPGSPAKRAGLLAFWNRYKNRMTKAQKTAYLHQAQTLWRCRDLEFEE